MVRSGIPIGKASEQTGLSVDAIRFYEKQRLLDRPLRTEGGFRLFSTEHIQRIQFIRHAQQLGFSLPEIRELLLLESEKAEVCAHVRDVLQAKVATVRDRIRDLKFLQTQLTKRLRKCERRLKVSADSHRGRCPMLEQLAHDEGAEER
jgi:DNA-binding transcriptional MerR regulator